MNEVDSDNNIVGDVPFYDFTYPSKKSTSIQKVGFVLKCILGLVIIAGLIAGIVYIFRKFGKQIKAVKVPKVMSKAATQPKFNLFADEEAASRASTTDQRQSESRSMQNLFGLKSGANTPPPPPPKKTFG